MAISPCSCARVGADMEPNFSLSLESMLSTFSNTGPRVLRTCTLTGDGERTKRGEMGWRRGLQDQGICRGRAIPARNEL
ncbi:unnamed protein product [Clonostachys chloroleuca]|uniref:Uncharacterized protein n=1 Tax=Clonostachys chloroleuca TaxID=1926264 RepID=A0AA35Q2K5_9HYPO|nr:unnamed protein product [Clonostachys chloroleuca]